jgi:hypothetical protein
MRDHILDDQDPAAVIQRKPPGRALSRRRAELERARPSEPGFTSLYAGTGTAGWEHAGPGGFTEVEGTLSAEGGMGVLWYAGRRYRDFTLRLDWMTTGARDDSGVFVRFPDPGGDPWVAVRKGYEVQIDDASSGSLATGAIHGVKAPAVAASKPPGEWNTFEITAKGRRYTVVLNGIVVTTFDSTGEARGLGGHVGIQNHDGSPVRFRDIRIREL